MIYKVNFRALDDTARQIEMFNRRLKVISDTFNLTGNALDWELIKANSQIHNQIKAIQNELDQLSVSFAKHRNYLESTCETYRRLENDICQNTDALSGSSPSATRSNDKPSTYMPEYIPNTLTPVLINQIPVISAIESYSITFENVLNREETIVEPWLQSAAQKNTVS